MRRLKFSALIVAAMSFAVACNNDPETNDNDADQMEMNDGNKQSGDRSYGDGEKQDGNSNGSAHDGDHSHDGSSHDGSSHSGQASQSTKDGKRKSQKELSLSEKEIARLDSIESGLLLMTTTLRAPQSTPIINDYLRLKDALVSQDIKAIKAAAGKIDKALKGNEDGLAEEIWDEAHEIAIEDELEEMREEFQELSIHVYQLAKQVNTGVTLYWMHCEAEFDNRPSRWLSSSKTGKSPYFSGSQANCGQVRQSL